MSYKDGSFEGVANGYHDIIKVQVQILDGRIEKIDYEHRDTPDTGGLAIQHIVEQVIKKQTTNVPRVPGVRYSSIGILEAINKALNVSKGKITQEEASKIRRQKTEGVYSSGNSSNMITKPVDVIKNDGKIRIFGGSIDIDAIELLLEAIEIEFRVYDQHGRLQYYNRSLDNNHTEFHNIGMHIVDLHENDDFFEVFEKFRTSEKKILNLSSSNKIVKLITTDSQLLGYVEY